MKRRRESVSPASVGRGRGVVRPRRDGAAGTTGRRGVAPGVEPLEPRQLFCAVHEAPLWLGGDGTAGGPAFSFPPSPGTPSGPQPVGAAAAPLPGLPQLHSFPTAPTAIYLDFNGNGSNAPYNESGSDAGSFDAAEQANITKAWQQMSAYFAPFNVNVTTVKPTVPTAWGLITNSLSGPGYSYVGVFPNNMSGNPQSFNPSGDARGRQSGIAHEIGHNFGLSHQSDYDGLGNKTNEYSSGYDSTHGPLMGVDYAQNVHKWFLGHGSGSPSSLQDDVAVIAAKIAARPGGGDGFRPDDFGNSAFTASPLTVAGGVQAATGIIERMADADVFSFAAAAAGRMAVDVAPVHPSGLVPKVEVYDAAGNLLAAKDDADARGTNNNDVAVAVDLPAAGTYYALVRSHGDYGDIGRYDITATDLPAGWGSQFVGTPSTDGGYATYNPADGTFRIAGAGGSQWGTSDQAQYAHTALSGDGSVTVRVTAQENTNAFAKAGILVRETLAQNARIVALNTTPTSGIQFLRRTSVGGSLASTTTAAAAFAPTYLRLTRAGNTFTAERSADGAAWTPVGSATVTMNVTVSVGLFSYAFNANVTSTAQFANLTTSGGVNASPTRNALAAPSDLTAAPGTGTGVHLSWSDVPGNTGYAVERSLDGTDFARVATTAAGATTYADAGLWGSMRYVYRVRAVDAAGQSAPSARVAVTNRPNAPGNFSVTSWQTSRLILNWRDVSGEVGYRVERSTDGGATFATLATVGPNVPSYTDINLATATAYAYRVVPISVWGDGPATPVVTESTRLAATTGLAFTTVASNRMAFQWNAVPGATGYRVDRSTNGTSFTALGTLGPTVTSYDDATVAPLGEYYYRVVGTNAQTEGMWATPLFAAAPAAVPLPTPWQSQDVGAVAGSGATGHANGTFTVLASGSDIWGTADQFRFTSMPLVGDGQIVARVNTLENTNDWAKAGVMVRETLAANARSVLTLVSAANGTQFAHRATPGGTTTAPTGQAAPKAPYWVRLERSGNTFTGYTSPDGSTWTLSGTATVTMTSKVYVGLALTSHAAAELAKATFDNVTVTTAPTTVQSTVVSGGAAQRSRVTGLTVTFDRPVAAYDAGAFALTRAGGGAAAVVSATLAPDGMSAALSFSGAGTEFGSLADGIYELLVRPALLGDQAGQAGAGPDQSTKFHRLFSDGDGDGDSDNADLFQFRGAYGKFAADPGYRPEFDYDADGDVDAADLFQVRSRRTVEYKGY